MQTDLLTEQAAAAFLSLQPQTLSKWRCTKRYQLAYVKIGGRVRYRRTDLENFIMAGTHNATCETEAA